MSGLCKGEVSWDLSLTYRRRLKTEEKAKVVAAENIIYSIPCGAIYSAMHDFEE